MSEIDLTQRLDEAIDAMIATAQEHLVHGNLDEAAPKLYVPVTEAHLVSKYVGTGKARPPLNTLGGTRWARVPDADRSRTGGAGLAGDMSAVYLRSVRNVSTE